MVKKKNQQGRGPKRFDKTLVILLGLLANVNKGQKHYIKCARLFASPLIYLHLNHLATYQMDLCCCGLHENGMKINSGLIQ